MDVLIEGDTLRPDPNTWQCCRRVCLLAESKLRAESRRGWSWSAGGELLVCNSGSGVTGSGAGDWRQTRHRVTPDKLTWTHEQHQCQIMFNKTVDDAHHADWDGSRLICDGLRLHARTLGAARWGAQCLPSYSLTEIVIPRSVLYSLTLLQTTNLTALILQVWIARIWLRNYGL